MIAKYDSVASRDAEFGSDRLRNGDLAFPRNCAKLFHFPTVSGKVRTVNAIEEPTNGRYRLDGGIQVKEVALDTPGRQVDST